MKNWSLFYFIIWIPFKYAFDLFYRSYKITGKENIPKNKPIIFAANHQNALMDPLSIIFAKNHQPVFLARAGAFKSSIGRFFLKKLHVLPAYRTRDGIRSVKKNEEVFDLCIDVLKSNGSIGLFPEAKHHEKRHLLKIQKATARIAFPAEERNNFNLDIQIVPVGIYYDEYTKSGKKLLVNFGKAIPVRKYKEIYLENKNEAYEQLRVDLRKALLPLCIHVDNIDLYKEYEELRNILNFPKRHLLNLNDSLHNRFLTGKNIIEKLDILIEKNKMPQELIDKTRQHISLRKKLNIPQDLIEKYYHDNNLLLKFLFNLLVFPMVIAGAIIHIIPILLSRKMTKKIKDQQFHSTVRYGLAGTLYPVIYAVIMITCSFFFSGIHLLYIFIGLFLLTSIYFRQRKRLSESFHVLSFRINMKRENTIQNKLWQLQENIINICQKYSNI